MTDPVSTRVDRENGDEITLLGIAAMMLRGRRTIIPLALFGMILGLAFAFLRPRTYTSSATFIPQESDQTMSPMARAASQLGITIPSTGAGWGPPVYVELLKSQTLLEPIASDTLVVPEEGGKRIPVAELFGVGGPPSARKSYLAVRALKGHITASEEKSLTGVRVAVETRWPSVSLMLANRLVSAVGTFNVERRKSQAAAERQFVDGLASDAEARLRAAEDELQSFLSRNREYGGSPQLAFDRDRLQRQVSLRQQLYTSLLQNREEARIREVRDTPVITVLEDPQLPVVPESRKVVLKTILGLLGGLLLGILITFLAQGLAGARMAPSREEREFFELLAAAKPRFRRTRREKSERSLTAAGGK